MSQTRLCRFAVVTKGGAGLGAKTRSTGFAVKTDVLFSPFLSNILKYTCVCYDALVMVIFNIISSKIVEVLNP